MTFGHECCVGILKGWMFLDRADAKQFISCGMIISTAPQCLIIAMVSFPNRTVIWDKNNITAQGFQDIAVAMEK